MAVSWPEIAAHRERLVRVARRRVPTREDAEDVVQEAMLRCATFEELDEARLGQFLTAVTMRLCADVHRHSERSARAFRRLDHDDVPSPEEAACAAAEAGELRELLATLPARQRDVLVDRASGMSVSQISSRYALTYKATESALSRARSTMRVALAAAMSFLGALVATVRRRPSVALAAPLTMLAFVTTVVHTPDVQRPPEVTLAPAPAFTAPVAPEATSGAGGLRDLAPVGASGAAARWHGTVGGTDGGPHSQEIAHVELLHKQADLSENDEHDLSNAPEECVQYGMTVTITIEWSGGVPTHTLRDPCNPPPR
jgi:RNA polymerase sigma-70 factor (ECF subfamily)